MEESEKSEEGKIKSKRERSVFYFLKGIDALRRERNLEKAERFFGMSLDEDNENTASRLFLLNIYLSNEDYSFAEKLILQAIENSIGDPALWKSALLYMYLKMGKKTDDLISLAKELSERSQAPLLSIAVKLEMDEKFEELKNFLKDLIPHLSEEMAKLALERVLWASWKLNKNISETLNILKDLGENFKREPFVTPYLLEAGSRGGEWELLRDFFEYLANTSDFPEEKAQFFISAGEICEFYLNDIKSASQFYLKSFLINPAKDESYERCVRCFEKMGDMEMMKRVLSERLKATPKDANVILRLAEILISEGNLEQSLNLLKIINPEKDKLIAQKYIKVLEEREDWKSLAEFIHLLLSQEWLRLEDYEHYSLRLAEIYLDRLSDIQRAEKILLDTGKKYNSLRAYSYLKDLYTETRRWKELISVLDEIIRITIDPKETIALLFQKGEIYEFRLMDIDSALSVYEELYQIAPNYMPCLDALKRIYEKKKNWRKLIWVNDVKRGIITDEKEHMNLLRENLYISKEKLKDEENYIFYLQKVLEYEPYDLYANLELYNSYMRKGNKKEAFTIIKRLTEDSFPEAVRRNFLAHLFLHFQELMSEEEAQNFFEAGKRIAGDDEKLWDALIFHSIMRKKDEELSDFIQSLDLRNIKEPLNRFLLNFACWSYERNGKAEKLKNLIKEYRDLFEKEFDPFLNSLSMRAGEEDKFEKLFKGENIRSTYLREIKGYLHLLGRERAQEVEEFLKKGKIFFHLLNTFLKETEPEMREESIQFMLKKKEEFSSFLLSQFLLRGETKYIPLLPLHGSFECGASAIEAIRENNFSIYVKAMENYLKEKKDPFIGFSAAYLLFLENIFDESLKFIEDIEDEEIKIQALYLKGEILEKTSRFEELQQTLHQISQLVKEPERKKEILKKKVFLEVEKLKNLNSVIQTSLELYREFPEEVEIINYVKKNLHDSKMFRECSDYLLQIAQLTENKKLKIDFFLESAHLAENVLKDDERAIEILKIARNALPEESSIADRLSALLEKKERWDELSSLLENRLSTEPPENHAQIYYYLGKIKEIHKGEIDSAISSYLSALEINPNHIPSISRLITLYYRKGEVKKAEPYARSLEGRMEEIEPEILAVCGEIFLHLKDTDISRKFFDSCLNKDPNNLTSMKGLMSIYSLKEDWNSFFETGKKFSGIMEKSLPGGASEIYEEMGRVAIEKLNKPTEALNYFKRATVLDPSRRYSQLWLARIFTDHIKDFKQGALEGRKAVEMDPEEKEGLHLYAKCLYLTKNYDRHFVILDILNYLGDLDESERKLYEISSKRANFYPEENIPSGEVLNYLKLRGDFEDFIRITSPLDKISWRILENAGEIILPNPLPEHERAVIDLRKAEKLYALEKCAFYISEKGYFRVMTLSPFRIIFPKGVIDEVNGRRFFFSAGFYAIRSGTSFLIFNDEKTIKKVFSSLCKYGGIEPGENIKSKELYDEKLVKKVISWKELLDFKKWMKEMANLPEIEIGKLKEELEKNMWKCAFSLFGFPSRALKIIDENLKSEDLKKSLLRFALTEGYYSIRRLCKISVGG